MKFTKAKIVESTQNQTDFPLNRSSEIVEALLEIIKKTLTFDKCYDLRIWQVLCERQKEKKAGIQTPVGI